MTSINAVVLDDQDVNLLINLIQGDGINIESHKPSNIESDIKVLVQKADLIIVDQDLRVPGKGRVYWGTTLIQELRTSAAFEGGASLPIVLWSMDNNIESYQKEESGHNLVDLVIKKEDVRHDSPNFLSDLRRQMISLVDGYRWIARTKVESTEKDTVSLFSLDSEYSQLVSEGVIAACSLPDRSVHGVAQFLLNAVLRRECFLVTRETVAIRLGFQSKDPDGSECSLWSAIESYRYKGVFSDFSSRWWMGLIEEWWDDYISDEPLISLKAHERVELINEKLGMELEAAEAAEQHSQTDFWHRCIFTGEALGVGDGFRLLMPERRSWQDDIYASFHAINLRAHKTGPKKYELQASDLDRFKRIKAEI